MMDGFNIMILTLPANLFDEDYLFAILAAAAASRNSAFAQLSSLLSI
jgi:hypothetical protein